MLWSVSAVILGIVVLVWSADLFVDGASAIAKKAGLTPMLIGLTIVSIGTSAPEILISIMSALSGSGELAVGNALGSNIANIGLVLGITLLIKPISIKKPTTMIDLPLLLIAVLLTGLLLLDHNLSTYDSYILLGGLLLFFLRIIHHTKNPENQEPRAIPDFSLQWALLCFLSGLLFLISSSRALVWGASNIALNFGVSELVVGLTIVAIGTSLPELAASVISALRGHTEMAMGAIIGSNMFNILLVLAIPGLWGSLPLSTEVLYRDLVMVFLTTTVLALAALWRWNRVSGFSKLGKESGALLLSLYFAYYIWLFVSP